MGVVPSGAYLAKKLLLDAADGSGQWWWTIVLQGGAVFTAGYVVLVLASVLRRRSDPLLLVSRVSRLSELVALALSAGSLLLALAALGPVPGEFVSSPFAPKEMGVLLVVFLGGSLLASGLSRRSLLGAAGANAGVMRRIAAGVGESFELADGVIRRWQFASISLLMLAILFGGALVWGAPPS